MYIIHVLLFVLSTGPTDDAHCSGTLTRQRVIECAEQASPRVQANRQRVAAARAEVDAARVMLPSNPTVAVTVGQRWNTVGDRALNVTGTLSQRIEIGGQRHKRKEAATARADAEEHDADATRRAIIANALDAYYDVLAAREEVEVIERGHATATRLHEVASARASAGLGAPMEGDLTAADAAGLRANVALATGRVRVAEARLASALGLDPARPLPEVRGALTPMRVPSALDPATEGAGTRPELAREQAHRRAEMAQLRVLKRERVPSPSLSFFAQTDGFNERVIGGGLSFPIPLPAPLGRTHKGHITATRARIGEAESTVAAQARELSLEAVVAYHEFDARKNAADAYSPQAIGAARRSLEELSAEIERGQLPVRDALMTKRALVDLLLRAVESRHALCRASVSLALAAGTAFEGAGQ